MDAYKYGGCTCECCIRGSCSTLDWNFSHCQVSATRAFDVGRVGVPYSGDQGNRAVRAVEEGAVPQLRAYATH